MSVNSIQKTQDTASLTNVQPKADSAEIEVFSKIQEPASPKFNNINQQFTWLLDKGEKVVDRKIVKIALAAPTWMKGLGMKWKDAEATQKELLDMIKQEKKQEDYILQIKNYVKKDGRTLKDVFADKKCQDELISLTKTWLSKQGKTNIQTLLNDESVDKAIREFMTDFDNKAYKEMKP